MGFFDIFKKKQDSAAADIPESRQQQQEELNAGLEKTKTGIFSKLARAVAGRSTVDADLLDDAIAAVEDETGLRAEDVALDMEWLETPPRDDETDRAGDEAWKVASC